MKPLRLVELMPRAIFLLERLIGSNVGRLAFSAKLSELSGPPALILFMLGYGGLAAWFIGLSCIGGLWRPAFIGI